MSQSILRNIILIISGLGLMNAFINCGGFGFDSSLSIYEPTTKIFSKIEQQQVSIQSSEQLARSMASVTNVEYNSAIINEYNARKSLMSIDYTLDSVTSPMMISISNLSSQFCNELIRKETALDKNSRNYFKNVDFTKGLNEVQDADYNLVLDTLGLKFWGRKLSNEERSILNETKNDFVTATPEAARTTVVQTRNLILSTCTVMLSSFDFITI